MVEQETRKQLDRGSPNKTFKELIKHKINDAHMTREEAIRNILKTSVKMNPKFNKELGWEDKKMTYGYTVAEAAASDIFDEVVDFVKSVLHFVPSAEPLKDVDGSICQHFKRGTDEITVESDAQVDYVGICSNVPLPIKCLHKWTTE